MFSAQNDGPAMATRSRRRQRPLSSDNSIQQPKAKRQRVPLTEQTFVNPDAAPEMYEVKATKVAKLSTKPDGIENIPATTTTTTTTTAKRELSVRSKKPKAGERISKGDGSVVLTTNTAYTVSKLPALPDRIRADFTSRQHGIVYSSTGYALCLTHTHAVVWPYTANTTSPETFTFTLPYPSRHVSDPLPLGALVAPSTSSEEPGLVVVMPVTGKITYWESISSAATLDFMRQQRNGVEETVPGIFSGEHVTQIVNADSAGFVLAFSSGRLAHLSVRDGHGRPGISVQFLRNGLGAVSGGFLGSIRHVLKHSAVRGDLAAVRAGPVARLGERTIVAATSKGKIHAWRVHRGGHHEALIESDARETIIENVQRAIPGLNGSASDSFEVVDFTFVPKGIERKYLDATRLSNYVELEDESALQLLLLVSFTSKRQTPYALVELILSRDQVSVGMIRPITSYFGVVDKEAFHRPRLYLPKPALVAYLVFSRAVVIASLATPPDTPDSQLQEDVHVFPATFEDVIDLRNDDNLEIVGSGIEEVQGAEKDVEGPRPHRHKTKNPTTVLMVRGVGIVRVATTDIDRFASEKPPQVTAKSKLEQAVFFGIKSDNPLVFEGQRETQFSSKEIGEAALQLSHEILSSQTPYVASLPASLEQNLRTRTNLLERLMSHLNALKIDLGRQTRWSLLWNAEKMTSATRIWLQHEQFLADRADVKGDERKSMVSEIVEYIHEDEKKNPNKAKGEVDRVRHFFINDVWRLEIFVAWAYEVIKYVYKDHLLDDRGITRLLFEAVQINYHALHGALEYRKTKLHFYGLGDEKMENGILAADYAGLTEPWTSTSFIINNEKRLLELCCTWLEQYYPPQTGSGSPDPGLIESIREDMPKLVDQYLISLQEQSRWGTLQEDPKQLQFGQRCQQIYEEESYAKPYGLKDFGLWDESIAIAEKHRRIRALADLMVEEVRALRVKATNRELPSSRASDLRLTATAKEKRIAEYFDKYKEDFAFAVYDVLLRDEGVKAVLDFPGDQYGYATKFLRTKPELAKISWINDVERENDIQHAAETLLDLGLTREQQAWNKKIELSLGKLALMAESMSSSDPVANDANGTNIPNDEMDRIDQQLTVIKIQDIVYNWVFPTISLAVDESAELDLAMESHGGRIPKKQKALHQVFEDGMGRLLKHEALDPLTLIDLLTLITTKEDDDERLVTHDPYFLALRVAEYSLSGEERRQAQRLIWRRCFIRDDWAHINNTELQSDESTTAAVGGTAPYATVFALYANRKFPAPSDPIKESSWLTFPPVTVGAESEKNFYPLLKPSEALGVYTAELDQRFDEMDNAFQNKLRDGMKAEDTLLKRFIDKSRLDEWWRTVVEAAEKTCQAELDALTEDGAAQVANGVNGEANGSNGVDI
ncbi:uncharacterized protein E0L32_000181 [Thyridium curvatum]|uniref:Nuclear pore complex protein n=1 Tax=Thyridium curvatum TaxID=1093900 RepID=A0A507B7S1_9PEZI|nr:uncharacterized protein E0L32_000181 [Thyridium curvatum]TPX15847.1 hypothetical protein E0L32_000181 [Thyridium curvatum]